MTLGLNLQELGKGSLVGAYVSKALGATFCLGLGTLL